MSHDVIFKSAKCQARDRNLCLFGEQELRGNLLLHTLDKIRRRFEIEWHYNSAAEQTAVERRDPFRTILAPEEHAIAGADPTRFEFASKLNCGRSQTRVGPSRGSQPTPVRDSGLRAVRDTVVEKSNQRVTHNPPVSFTGLKRFSGLTGLSCSSRSNHVNPVPHDQTIPSPNPDSNAALLCVHSQSCTLLRCHNRRCAKEFCSGRRF